MHKTNDNKLGWVSALGWIRRNIKPLAVLLLVVAIMACIFYFYWLYPGMIDKLKAYFLRESANGYLGAFVISVILNATIILPVSNMAVMIALGVAMPSPVLVGLVGGLGAGVGELTGYIAGRSGRNLIAQSKMYGRIEDWVRRWGWLAIFILSVVPFFFDLVGIAAGALRLPLWKFFVPCWLGRTILYVVMVMAATYGLKILVPSWFG